MGRHSGPDAMERTRDLYLTSVYRARHVDVERQPGRSPDGVPDEDYELIIDRGPNDPDLWDRW
jgi:hypothetical protein